MIVVINLFLVFSRFFIFVQFSIVRVVLSNVDGNEKHFWKHFYYKIDFSVDLIRDHRKIRIII